MNWGNIMTTSDALAILSQFGDAKIADVYDENESVGDALQYLFPGYEYPEWSHLTGREIIEIWKAS